MDMRDAARDVAFCLDANPFFLAPPLPAVAPTFADRAAKVVRRQGALQACVNDLYKSHKNDHDALLHELCQKVDDLWSTVTEEVHFYTTNLQEFITETVRREVQAERKNLLDQIVNDALRQADVMSKDQLLQCLNELGIPTARDLQDAAEEVAGLRADVALLLAKVECLEVEVELLKPANLSIPIGTKKCRPEEPQSEDIVVQFSRWRKAFAEQVPHDEVFLADRIFVNATTDKRGNRRKLLGRHTILAQRESLHARNLKCIADRKLHAAVEVLFTHLVEATLEGVPPPRDGKWPGEFSGHSFS